MNSNINRYCTEWKCHAVFHGNFLQNIIFRVWCVIDISVICVNSCFFFLSSLLLCNCISLWPGNGRVIVCFESCGWFLFLFSRSRLISSKINNRQKKKEKHPIYTENSFVDQLNKLFSDLNEMKEKKRKTNSLFFSFG